MCGTDRADRLRVFSGRTHLQRPESELFPGWSLAGYQQLFALGTIQTWLFNTVLVSTVGTVLTVLVDLMAAFAFSKLKWRGRDSVFLLLISTMMLPFSVTLVPTYLIANSLGLTDNYAALILPGLSAPLGTFLLRQFVRGIPDELLESARVDGASNARIFVSMIVPLSAQPMAVLAILTFVANWNNFLWPLLVIQTDSLKTLTVGLATTSTEFSVDLSSLTATTVISLVPMAILFFAFQRYFLRGVTAGAVKG
ncbi:carbohydrate ABC transporter permease [Fodinicola feengrottensis]|uniref:carbohydrate ABC transporter permease n=1 Tax=Fodinicola feengrottensis TaxID=435914 RepID=UPI0013D7A4AF|nr:carbohydrate ABC transporter permease [Fodinicola feengrottensis]